MVKVRILALPRLYFRRRETKAREIERVVNAELLKLSENIRVVDVEFLSEFDDATPIFCVIRTWETES